MLERTGFKILAVYRFSILSELVMIKMLDLIRGKKKPNQPTLGSAHRENTLFARIGAVMFSLVDFVARYKVGSLMPKRGRPQTIIVVARKSERLI